ncbi:MAG: cyclic pyranopterin monophosphate synthase MoaC, partial [Thermoleophilia bacterium]|nr:cyclic pyranopterin monophosphate synthase MoaC [Thermoleophilia bacterium]
MVDVGAKEESRRRAVAQATVRMRAETASRLRGLPKGDALATAELAGVMAAKRTSELIPLCHPLPISHVDVSAELRDDGVEITA